MAHGRNLNVCPECLYGSSLPNGACPICTNAPCLDCGVPWRKHPPTPVNACKAYRSGAVPNKPVLVETEQEGEIRRLRDALEWYAERAASLAAKLQGFKEGRDADYVMAILTELALDGGGRAKKLGVDLRGRR